AVRPDHPEAHALERLLHALRDQERTRVVVMYLRENVSALGDALDSATYEAEAQRFIERVQRELEGARRCRFVVVPAAQYAGEYVDHIHLTARGYARLAQRLSRELPP